MRALFLGLVGLVAAAHFAFLLYLPAGGFLALRWRRTIWLHATAVAWAIGSVALHFWCPLTTLERWARERAALPPLGPAGFIEHYVAGRLYPQSAAGGVQALALTAVLVSWALYLATCRRSGAAAARSRAAKSIS